MPHEGRGGKEVCQRRPEQGNGFEPVAAGFSLIMLASMEAGDAYTFMEYEKMFRNAGFPKSILHPIPDMPQQILVSEKAG